MGMRIHYDATKYQRARNVHVSLHLNVAFDFRIAGNIKQRSGNFGTAIRHLDVRTASLNKDGTVFQGYGCVLLFQFDAVFLDRDGRSRRKNNCCVLTSGTLNLLARRCRQARQQGCVG